jgi:hypothetical protein
MKTYCENGGIAPRIRNLALDRGEWSASRPGRFTPGVYWIGKCVSPRAGLGSVAKVTTYFYLVPKLRMRGA